jgi:hypothetical protein
MERLKYSFRGIVVVSAAVCWFFSAVQPTLASTLIVILSPTLTAVPTSVYPGDPIEISGSSFSQCERHATGPNVMVYWDGSDWAQATAFHSGFSVNSTVPSDAPAGSHQVTAACYDPASTVSSLPLASADVRVLPGPGLQLSSSQAAVGGSVTAVGTGFGQCPGKGLGDDVQLLWDAAPLGGPVGLDGNGAFSEDVTIPAAATAGTGHTVAAECYDPAVGSVTSGVLASQPFTVTPPPSTSSPPSTPPASPTTQVNSPTVTPTGTVATPRYSPTVISGQSPTAAPGRWSPVALATGVGGGLAVVVVLLAGLLAMHARARPRNSPWVHQHLRTVARPLDTAPPNMRIHSRPGAAPLSVGLEPRPDRLGDQQVKEIPP